MAIIRYAGDRFTANTGDTRPTGVLQGAFLINTGDRSSYVKTGNSSLDSDWAQIQGGGGGGGSPSGANTQVQFNDNGSFAGSTGLTFDGQRLYANNFQLSGILYDSNASVGEGGMVLANEGTTGVHWKNIESVLSGVGGSGVANYVAKWSDEDTLTSGIIQDNGTDVSIISSTTNKPVLRIENTNADNTPPFLDFYKNSASAADDDYIGKIQFKAKDSLGTETTYADIYAIARDITHTTEDGNLYLRTLVGGSMENSMFLGLGKVGIATNVPVTELEVYGASPTIRISDSTDPVGAGSTIGKLQFYGSDGSSGGADVRTSIETISENAAGNAYRLAFLTSAGNTSPAEKVTIRSDGNVGIGTTAPESRLHVRTATGGSAAIGSVDLITVENDDYSYINLITAAGVNASAGIIFSDDVRARGYIEYIHRNGSADQDYLKTNVAGSEVMRIISDGNVGIGTDAPAANLHIASTSVPALRIHHDSTSSAAALIQLMRGTGDAFGGDAYTDWQIQNEGGFIKFQYNDTAAGSLQTPLVVSYAGNVGIGDNLVAPEHRLHVSGDAIISGVLYDSTNSSGVSGHVLTSEVGGPQWKMIEDVLSGVGGNGTANYVPRWVDSDTIGDSVMAQSGSAIGIGTAAPTTLLEVNESTDNTAIIRINSSETVDDTPASALDLFASSSTAAADKKNFRFTNLNDANSAGQNQLQFQSRDDDGSYDATLMVIEHDGKVGIGTNAPSSRGTLEVVRAHQALSAGNGGISVLSSDSWAINKGGQIVFGGAISASDTSRTFGLIGGYKENTTDGNRAGYLQFGVREGTGATDIVERMRIQSDGNVGIGTTAPARLLHLYNGGNTDDTAIRIQTSDKTSQIGYFGLSNKLGVDFAGAAIQFRAVSNSYATAMIMQSDGNIGIGTAAPKQKLHIFQTEGGVGVKHATIRLGGYLDKGAEIAAYRTSGNSNNMGLRFSANNVTNGIVDVMTLDDAGHVGIGTLTPDSDAQLHVAGYANKNTILSVGSSTSGQSYGILNQAGSTSADYSLRVTSKAGSEYLYVRGDGNVGIGNAAPVELLHVGKGESSVHGQILISADSGLHHYLRLTNGGGTSTHYPTGIWYAPSGRMELRAASGASTSNVAQLVLAADGNVGIGTITPSMTLEVAGQMLLKSSSPEFDWVDTGAASNEGRWRADVNNSGTWALKSTNDAVSDSNDAISITRSGYVPQYVNFPNGKVGIGTTAPGACKLTVNGSGGFGSSSDGVIIDSESGYGIIQGTDNLGNSFNGLKLRTQGYAIIIPNSAAPDVEIVNKLGIGTNAPEGRLHIENASSGASYTPDGGDILIVENSDSALIDIRTPAANAGGIMFSDTVRSRGGIFYYHEFDQMNFATGGTNPQMIITSDGTLDIKSAKLKINGSGGSAGQTLTTDGSGNISWSAAGSGTISGSGTDNYVPRFNGTSAVQNSAIYAKDDGNVGIGTNAPDTNLEIYQSDSNSSYVHFTNSTTGGGADNGTLVGIDAAENFRIHNYEATDNIFVTNGIERMRILSDGKVGIGTTAPAAALDVRTATAGGGIFDMQDANTAITSGYKALALSNSNATAGNHTAINFSDTVGGSSTAIISAKCNDHTNNYGDLQFWTRGATGYGTRLHIDQEGSVGIGTAVPVSPLHVKGTTNTNIISIGVGHADGSVRSHWGYDAGGNTTGFIVGTAYNSNAAKFQIRMKGTASSDAKVTILGDGNVGIGTTAPENQLHVYDGSINCYVKVDNGSDNAAGVRFKNPTSEWYVYNTNAAGGGNLRFWENSGSDINFTPAGKIGIGTTAPTADLHVYEGSSGGTVSSNSNIIAIESNTNNGLQFLNPSANNANINFGDNNANEIGFIQYQHATDKMNFRAGGTTTMTLVGGSVGIGTNAPGKLLTLSSTNAQLMLNESDQSSGSQNWLFNAEGGTLYFQALGGTAGSVTSGSTWMQAVRSGTTISSVSFPSSDVGIGTNAPDQYAKLHTLTDGTDNQLRIEAHRNDVGQTSVRGYFSRGSAASPVIVQNNDTIFEAQGWGYDGTNHWRVAEIDFQVDGTPGTNDMPGRLVFSTTADGATAPTERMRIASTGKVGIGTTAPTAPLDFGVTTTNSRVLHLRQNGNSKTGFGISNDYGVRAFGPSDASATGALFEVGEMSNTTFLGGLFTVTYEGKVGIGTTAPAEKVHIYGAGTQVLAIQGDGGSGPKFTIRAGGTLTFSNDNTPYMNLNASGRFTLNTYGSGTHTGTAAYKLSVTSGGIVIETPIGAGAVDGSGTANYVTKWTDSDTIGNSSIFDNGSVGIGTNVVEAKLHVEYTGTSTTVGEGLFINNISNTTGHNASVVFSNDSGGRKKAALSYVDTGTYGSGDLVFALSPNNSTVLDIVAHEKMRVKLDGNVGIGTTAPTGKLQVKSGQAVFDDSTDTGAPSITFEGDLDTGFLREGANIIGVTTGGVRRWSIGNGSITSQITGGARIVQTNGTAGICAFSFNDDGDTGMYRGGTNILSFATAGTNRLSILADGKVGIGTATPGGKLGVYNSLTSHGCWIEQAGALTADQYGVLVYSTGNNQGTGGSGTSAVFRIHQSHASSTIPALTVRSDGTGDLLQLLNDGNADANKRFVVKSDGNVGMGTTAPATNLHVLGTAAGATFKFVDGDGRIFQDLSGGILSWSAASVFGSTSWGSTADFEINSLTGGRQTLQVNGAAGANHSLRVTGATTAGTPTAWIHNSNNTAGADCLVVSSVSENDAEVFAVRTNTTTFGGGDTDFIVKLVSNSPRVGIGTATPAAVLDIRGDNSTSAGSGLIIGQDASTDGGTTTVPNAWLKFYLNNIRNGAMIKAGRDSAYGSAALADGNLQFHTALNDTLAEHMRILSDGNVGIGTTAPSNRLEVNGNISFTAGDSLEWNNNAGTRINASHGSAFMSFDVAGTSAVLYLKPTAVGIGTNAPNTYSNKKTLEINATWGGVIENSVSGTVKSRWDWSTGGITQFGTYVNEPLHLITNSSMAVTILGDGKVGMGTLTPSTKLHAILDSAATNTPTDVLRLGHTSSGSTAVGFGALIRFDAERTGTTTDGMGRLGFVADVMTSSRVDGAFIVQTGLDGSYTERLRIASTGKIAIGNNIPMWSGSYGGALVLKGNDATADRYAQLGIVNSTGTVVYTGLVVDTVGNVGIGTTAPGQQLSVGNATAQTQIYTNGSGHSVFVNDTANKDMNFSVSGTGGHWFATGGANRLSIGSDGTLNLISAKLKINGSGGTAGYHLQTDGSGNISWAAAGSGGGGTVTGTGTDNYVPRWNGTTALQNSAIFSNDSGSVGIGTNAPGSLLAARKDQNAETRFFLTNDTAGTAAVSQVWVRSNASSIQLSSYSASFTTANQYVADSGLIEANSSSQLGISALGAVPIVMYTNSAERLRIKSDGNVGIGTTAPGAYKLRVEGDVYISGTLTEASSSGIKENIETYSPSLDIINKIRPVRYNKKKSNKKEVGLVAEELAEMFPELVEMDEKGNAVGVNYSRAVAVLLHGFKELYKEVKEIKEKI